MQREILAERIAARTAELAASGLVVELSDQQVEACARILTPVLTGEGVKPALHYTY